ncbi:hypothetical protein G7054_g13310 [Neopestalotiopsis clavispora]|nr:hypothetical protein G7054_g13310 [Neopestalotiopsis clavispora]
MADPLSIAAAPLAVVTAAIQSSKSLCATLQRYKERDKTLNRLHGELEDLINILDALQAAVGTEAQILKLLEGPIDRCNHVCRDFELAMEKFKNKSTLGLIDWARMEFMTSDINGFMDALAGYKATIGVGLGTITMRNPKINIQVLEEYNEMIKDTAYNLNIHLQRIDARLEQLSIGSKASLNTSTNLQDEKDVTNQCLRICEHAKAYIESMQNEQPSVLRQEASPPDNFGRSQFEAQLLTRKVFDENRGKLIEAIGCLQERLLAIVSSSGPERNHKRLQLQEDLDISK